MKNYFINNGACTAAGNFSGYTALGERVHLHKRQMDALGWSKNEDIKFPFYVIGEMKTLNKVDGDRKPIIGADGKPEMSERLTALSAFKTREEIKQAHADSKLLDIEIATAIKSQATSAGLTEADVKALSLSAI